MGYSNINAVRYPTALIEKKLLLCSGFQPFYKPTSITTSPKANPPLSSMKGNILKFMAANLSLTHLLTWERLLTKV